MIFKRGRYSGFLRPISYMIDLIIIGYFSFGIISEKSNLLYFFIYISSSWIVSTLLSEFYEVYRYTRVTKILGLIAKQTILFLLLVFAFFGFYNELSIQSISILKYIFLAMSFITIAKFSIYFLLKEYRKVFKGNLRKVVIVGLNKKTDQLRKYFNDNPDYGYQLVTIFDLKQFQNIEEIIKHISENEVDEIYSSIAELNNKELTSLIDFADNNLKILKFLPDNKEIYSKKLDFTYYDFLPILSMRRIPTDEPINLFVKRIFDVIFSLIVIIGVLSWLTPILGLIIKMESKGPIFFKQKRNGLDYKEFYCYKFRSMRPNPEAHLYQIKKNDPRVTRIGKIIRKTSIDELPQFINVLKGNMSVVGPRPHMVSHTHMYAEKIDKFMVRHFIKPGITGLAQVSGFRGEVEDDNFIINRVKYDIFYLENWSLLMDLKIVVKTVYNALSGDEKAY
ncbi:MAG: exopolysaccharide biosynthesis polyprenyl glycosylphosphotransferase [Flavobacteriaceae bacterium]|jgi:putative colanic acid biosynthesis UDP-glucose lipid carrier transferase|nr:exopolysaccharide biosynthesis polyprenyl glycosylphosphotransferase [Flavobacteriaceae bacterium]MDG2447177.1 exopolysaccharide biosynthesis polyprenyl glycosylphosphotransferase [Flavobacteriaceae bacterium]